MAIDAIRPLIKTWLEEDDLLRNYHYLRTLPQNEVKMELKIKSDLILAGTDFFTAVFQELGVDSKVFSSLHHLEGKSLIKGTVISFDDTIPFSAAVTGERLSLNLLHHTSSIATHTNKFVQALTGTDIKILDTRKSTPGLRFIEKYGVRVGGGFNHRFGQTDTWMVKDNHKTCLGGIESAVNFFKDQGAYYNDIIVEVHDLEELTQAQSLGITKIMLDNFTPDQIKEAVKVKGVNTSFEVSGGVNLDNLHTYIIDGVDAISTSNLVAAPKVDISFKFKPK